MSELTLLLVSDIHSNYVDLEAIIDKHSGLVDIILCMGDMVNMRETDQEDKEKVIKGEKENNTVLEIIEKSNCKCFYIPGNHDPVSLFSKPDGDAWRKEYITSKEKIHAKNLHEKVFKLVDGLSLICFGGAKPAYQDGKERWKGYPFNSEDELAKPMDPFLRKSIESIDDEEQIVLLTHLGPSISSTAVDNKDPNFSIIYTGSEALTKVIQENHKRIVMNLHGHSHHGVGMSSIGNSRIINCGAVKEGNYAVVKLIRGGEEEKYRWRIKETNFNSIL